MAWIESHQALGHHPKTIKLADALGVNILTAVGLIHFLWWWALDYAPQGIVKRVDQPAAARSCLWTKKWQQFWAGLVEAGFVELANDGSEDLVLHDWMDYAGKLMDRRAANAERTRAYRARHVAHHVMDTSEARDGATVPTVPNQPLTNQPDTSPLPPFAPSEGGCCPLGTITDGVQHSTFCGNAVPA